MKIAGEILIYLKYTKPRVWGLLVYIGVVGAIIGAGTNPLPELSLIMLATFTLIAGTAGSEAITNYIDRDIDSIMKRTQKRPLVTGMISPSGAMTFGIALIFLSIVPLLVFERYYAAFFMIAGIVDNVLIYSYFLKRKSSWNIVFGGFSGGLPVLIGWYVVTDAFSIIPWFLFTMVVIWIPIHIWSIAYLYREDYSNAGVPMLPVMYPDKISAKYIAFSAFLLSIFSIMIYFVEIHPIIYLIVTLVLVSPLIHYSYKFMKNPDKKTSLSLFKYSNLFLSVFFSFILIIMYI
jgi:protoheme IX farnesyltransferase